VLKKEHRNVNLHGLTLVVVAGAWLVGILIDSFVLLPSFALLIGAGVLLISIVLLWHESRNRLILCIILFMILGAWRYTSASPIGDPEAISRYIGSGLVVRGVVSDEPKLQGRSRLLSVTVHSISQNKGSSWQDAHGQMTIQNRGTELEDPYGANYGSSVEITGRLLIPLPYSAPGITASMFFPRVSVQRMEGNPIIAALYHWRTLLSNIIEQALPQPQAALLIAILLSAHTPALKPLTPFFNATGTAHLIAPSGFKVTILAGIVASNTTWFYRKKITQGKLLPAQKRGGWRRWLTTVLVIISIAVYTLLSGAGPAAIRAGIMGTLLVIAPRIGRSYNIYTALAVAALLMSAIDPFVLWEAGFQLSFLGTLGIVVLTPLFQRLLHPLERIPCSHYLLETFAVTLAAQTATLPVLALNFQELSFVAPLANMLTVPLLGMMITLGVLICGAGSIFMPLALLIGWVAQLLFWYLDHIIAWSAALPGAYINVGTLDSSVAWSYYALLIPVAIFALRKWSLPAPHNQLQQPHNPLPELSRHTWKGLQLSIALMIIVATGATALFSQSNERLTTITFLHVGPAGEQAQGEAILIRTPDNKTVLIDGGLDATSLAQELDSRLPSWQRSLDAVLLTTPRQDHLNGLLDIVQRYEIREVLDGGMLHPGTTYTLWRRTISERNFRYLAANQGMSINIGIFLSLQILWPGLPLHKGGDEVRDNGLIVRITMPGLRLLLLGASAQSRYALTGLLNDIDTSYLQAEVVQMVEEASTSFPEELSSVLQRSNPTDLLLTPAALSAKQRKTGIQAIDPVSALTKDGRWQASQIIQTAVEGTIEVSNSQSGWSINIV